MIKRITMIVPLAGLLFCSGCLTNARMTTTALTQNLAAYIQDFILQIMDAIAL